mmetsp:Transcript_39788/g.65960  ORF Transcript_39788/g.65960 Transcript_39788/m.65960 type:complete len:539 (+) Transcript_39788:99-1715(+)
MVPMKLTAQARRAMFRKLRPTSRIYALVVQAVLVGVVVLFCYVVYETDYDLDVASHRRLSNSSSLLPPNVFSDEQMKHGAVLLFVFLLLYMFVGIAIICDDYFVPALEEVIERWDISEDVAGATFMAAGGSAPEFATSLLGTFIFTSDVGFGTIIGSAVFNILFVIGLCAYFSGYPSLQLTWYPLVRDASFYLLSLIILVVCIYDLEVQWYDALTMTCLYIIYVIIMYFNEKIKNFAISFEAKHLRWSSSGKELEAERSSKSSGASTRQVVPLENGGADPEDPSCTDRVNDVAAPGPAASVKEAWSTSDGKVEKPPNVDDAAASRDKGEDDEERTSCWPDLPERTPGSIAKFIFLAPLLYSFALTVPDCRIESFKFLYGVTMAAALAWITLLTFLMVFAAEEICLLIGLPIPVMGVTVLAAGTSVPDAITSVLVARKGLGDMALSSSVGSNVFDINFGLPVPWLLSTIIRPGSVVKIFSPSLPIQVATLCAMVLVVVLSINCCKWQIDKRLGVVFFILYLGFVIEAILLEMCETWSCF